MDRAAQIMGTRQVAEAHQELPDDFAAGKTELLLEQLDPFRLCQRMMGVDPGREAAMAFPERLDTPGVLDHRIDLQPIADDPGIGQQPRRSGSP